MVQCLCVKKHSIDSLDAEFPGRFNRRLLAKVFARLNNRRRIRTVGIHYRGTGRRRFQHQSVYAPIYGPHNLAGYRRRSGPRRKKLARG